MDFDPSRLIPNIHPKLPELTGFTRPPNEKQTERLIDKTTDVHEAIAHLHESSKNLELSSSALLEATAGVRTELQTLNNLTVKVEGLTIKVKNLTWVLVALTVVVIIEPLGIEYWKAQRELSEPISPPVVQFLLPTVPQTPVHPAGSPRQ